MSVLFSNKLMNEWFQLHQPTVLVTYVVQIQIFIQIYQHFPSALKN